MAPSFGCVGTRTVAIVIAVLVAVVSWSLVPQQKAAVSSDIDTSADDICATRVAAGDCQQSALSMALNCSGRCEEDKDTSRLRGRVVLDLVISESLAKKVQDFAPDVVIAGDGYKGRSHVHSANEVFAGITPTAAAKWAIAQIANRKEAVDWAMAYIEVAKRTRAIVQDHFHVKALYFDYVHLVCRTRSGDAAVQELDSHPAHADNCFQRGSDCAAEAPFYHWRSHSAILFLQGPEDGSFQGGEFFFTPLWNSDPKNRVYVQPRAGRMVAFTAGAANIHGVAAVTNGTRCAVAVWFTPSRELAKGETELEEAEKILESSPVQNEVSDSQQVACAKLEKDGACQSEPLSMYRCPGNCEEDQVTTLLRGRVVKDDALPLAWCEQLIELAPEAAIDGDGYGGKKHPHTVDEVYSGISPAAAARWAQAITDNAKREKARAWASVYLDAVRRLQTVIEGQLDTKGLFLDYAHLTCRKRVGNSSGRRNSHASHADNCFHRKGECIRDAPFFHWRSHSAVAYLHGPESGDFSGGDFYFTPNFSTPKRARVTPKAGRAIVFTAGAANIHGVESVTRGTRCALNVWFTQDESRASFRHEIDTAEGILLNEEVLPPDDDNFMESFARLCNATSQNSAAAPQARMQIPLEGDQRILDVEVFRESSGPEVSYIRNFIDQEEIDHLIAKAQPGFKEATVMEHGKLVEGVNYRTSTSSWLPDDPKDPIITRIVDRIRSVTGLSLATAEHLQIGRYLSSNQGRYEPHFDWGRAFGNFFYTSKSRDLSLASSAGPKSAGDRIATVILYLSDVEEGGQTVFTAEGLSFKPVSGAMLFWYNLKASGQGDERVRHAGCPVLQGTKYIATKWIHERGNENTFHTAASLDRFSHDWQRIKEQSSGGQHVSTPPVISESCHERWSKGECAHAPMSMANACAGFCEDFAVDSIIRGRRLLESVISEDLATSLMKLASEAGVEGDGYGSKASPSSRHERAFGIAPLAAAEWALSRTSMFGRREAAVEMVRNYTSAVLRIHRLVAESFRDSRTMLGRVHLGCRERTKQIGTITEIDSQSAHAENCYLFSRYCIPVSSWQSHVAVLFLQDTHLGDKDSASELNGGDFFYQPDIGNRSGRVHIQPRLGRLVAYTAGPENINGVKEVVRGKRCVVQLWFTDNSTMANAELELRLVEKILDDAK